jgi:hypothetical protein
VPNMIATAKIPAISPAKPFPPILSPVQSGWLTNAEGKKNSNIATNKYAVVKEKISNPTRKSQKKWLKSKCAINKQIILINNKTKGIALFRESCCIWVCFLNFLRNRLFFVIFPYGFRQPHKLGFAYLKTVLIGCKCWGRTLT